VLLLEVECSAPDAHAVAEHEGKDAAVAAVLLPREFLAVDLLPFASVPGGLQLVLQGRATQHDGRRASGAGKSW
jgi:hypothetical protein